MVHDVMMTIHYILGLHSERTDTETVAAANAKMFSVYNYNAVLLSQTTEQPTRPMESP